MNKIKFLILLVFVLFLQACKVPEEEKPFDPKEVEVTLVTSGQLRQNDESVSEVTFSIEHNQPQYEPSKIVWFRNKIAVSEEEVFKYTPTSGLLSKTEVFARVSFIVDEVEHEIDSDMKEIKVIGKQAKIDIKLANQSGEVVIVENTLTSANEPINFEATLTGDYGLEDLSWWVIDEQTNLEVEQESFKGKANFSITPSDFGVLRIEARIGRGRFISNKIYIDSNYGKLGLSSNQENDNEIVISSSFNNELAGTYRWEKLDQDQSEYTTISDETNSSITLPVDETTKPSLYRLVFESSVESIKIVSEPILIAPNRQEVRTEAELQSALADKVAVIELKSNILYSIVDGPGTQKNPLVINYPVTIIGNGFELSSLGIFVFIQVNSDNVWFKDIKINHSSRYNVVVTRSENVYFENVEFIKPGGGSDMMTPGAGIYAHGSDVTVKNIKIIQGYNSGLRVEGIVEADNSVTKGHITILGNFDYKVEELVAPIISASSKSTDANISAVGYDEFIIPIGNGKMIRRWSNDPYGVKWQLSEPLNVEYKPGGHIDFSGIVINVRIGAMESTDFGLEFVYLFLDMFKETGTIRVTEPGKIEETIKEYTIYAYDRDIGKDFLLYKDEHGNQVKPLLPQELGDYQVHIWVGDTAEGEGLYLGYIVVRVIEPISWC